MAGLVFGFDRLYDQGMRAQWEIQTPCRQNVEDFDEAGFCSHCQQTVYDLSQFTRQQATELYYTNGQKLCVRLTRDAQGEVEFRAEPPARWSSLIRSWLLGIGMAATPAVAQEALPASCALEIQIEDQAGGKLPHARVSVSSSSKEQPFEVQGRSDESGLYKGAVPGRGSYEVQVMLPGFISWRERVTCQNTDKPIQVKAVLRVGTLGDGVLIDPVPAPVRKLQFGVKRLFKR
jgi:hypothetical protein